MTVKVGGDYTANRGITNLATFPTFISISILILNLCVLQMSAIIQPFGQSSVSAPEKLETERIISRELWDSIFKQWVCNSTICFKKYDGDHKGGSNSGSGNAEKVAWSAKGINHSDRISATESFNQNKQNNYGRVFLTVSFLLFLSILTISIARECRQDPVPTVSSRARVPRRRNTSRVRSVNTRSDDEPLESIQIISNSGGSVLNTENIGVSVQQREISLSYYYIEPRRMLWNSLHPLRASPPIQITQDDSRNSAQSSIFHPDFQVPSFYLPDCPPTYQEINVHELPSYNEAITNLICPEKSSSVDIKTMAVNALGDNINKNRA